MKITWLSLIFQGLVLFLLSSIDIIQVNIELFHWIIISCTTTILLLEISNKKYNNKSFIIIYSAYFYRLLLLIWDVYFSNSFVLPNSGSDAILFHNVGIAKSVGDFTNNYGGVYTDFLGYIYNFYGASPIIGRYINLLFSIGVIILIIQILDMLKINSKNRILGIYLISFLPNYAILSVVLRRESIIIYCVTISIYFIFKWYLGFKVKDFFFSILFALFASMFHSGALAILFGYFYFYTFLDKKNRTLKINKNSILALIIIMLFFYVANELVGETLFFKFQNVSELEDITSSIGDSRGGSGYSIGVNLGNTSLDFLVNTPIRVFYFLLSPMPWDWRGGNDIFAFTFSSIFYGYISIFSLKTFFEFRNEKNKYITIIGILLITLTTAVLMFSWAVSNAGTALRHRDKFISIYIILYLISKEIILLKRGKQNESNKAL